jgi:hypothetical protein
MYSTAKRRIPHLYRHLLRRAVSREDSARHPQAVPALQVHLSLLLLQHRLAAVAASKRRKLGAESGPEFPCSR